MKPKYQRYVLHESRKGKWSVFDNVEKRDIKGQMSKNGPYGAIILLKSMRLNNATTR